MNTTTDVPSNISNPVPARDSEYVCLPADALEALPALLRTAGLTKAAELIEEQNRTRLSPEKLRAYIEAARDIYFNEGDTHRTEIDDNAIVSHSKDGAYVMAWCWVYKWDAGLGRSEGEENGGRRA